MNRFGNNDHALLYIPPQDDLRRSLPVFFRDFLQYRLLKHAFQPLRERRPCLRLHSQFLHDLKIFFSLIVGMPFDLVDLRYNLHIITQIQQTVRVKIAHPNCTDLSFFIQLFHSPPGTIIISKRHMDQIKVQIVESKFL